MTAAEKTQSHLPKTTAEGHREHGWGQEGAATPLGLFEMIADNPGLPRGGGPTPGFVPESRWDSRPSFMELGGSGWNRAAPTHHTIGKPNWSAQLLHGCGRRNWKFRRLEIRQA